MRTINKHDLKNYLANKRITYIQKAHHRTYTKLQLINNELIDKFITEYHDEYANTVYDPYTEDNITSRILPVNAIASTKDLQRILQHSVVTRNPDTEIEAARVINSVSGTLTQLETERLIKNLDYVENVLHTADVDIRKYEALIEKLPPQTSRREVLERSIRTESELPPSKRQAWLERNLERGASYNKEYSYL